MTDSNEMVAMFTEALTFHVDNLMPIGVLSTGGAGHPENSTIISNRLHNVEVPIDGHAYACERAAWFIKE